MSIAVTASTNKSSEDDFLESLDFDTITKLINATLAASYTPSQTGNAGKFLTTDGTNTSWATLSADPAGTAVALAIALG
jgi:hypothetical protein